MRLFLLLLIVPLIEIFLFIEVGGMIGVWPTIGIVILTALIGVAIMRRQGLSALRNAQARIAAGENPGRLLADGAMILVAGVLLLTPGFLTDTLGLLLLVPPVRGWLWNRLAPRLVVVGMQGGGMQGGGVERRRTARDWPGGKTVVEGEFEEVDPAAGRRRENPADGQTDGPVRPIGHDSR